MSSYREVPVADYADAVGDDGQLIDVREVDEFAGGSLPGAVNLPLSSLALRVGELDPNRPVVVLCRSGGRSAQASQMLADAGFDTTNLAGGMLAMGDA